jgi:hypothetical protein
MERAGVALMGLFGIVYGLMRDWQKTPGLAEVLPFLDREVAAFGYIAFLWRYLASVESNYQDKSSQLDSLT